MITKRQERRVGPMEFLVRRTSSRNGTRPCAGAYRRRFVRIDERTTDDPGKVPAHRGSVEWWYREGVRHRVENGRIRRDFTEAGWFVRIGDLQDLLKLCDAAGDIIVRLSPLPGAPGAIPEIEIYDEFRQ